MATMEVAMGAVGGFVTRSKQPREFVCSRAQQRIYGFSRFFAKPWEPGMSAGKEALTVPNLKAQGAPKE
jgi:hypothetical protein